MSELISDADYKKYNDDSTQNLIILYSDDEKPYYYITIIRGLIISPVKFIDNDWAVRHACLNCEESVHMVPMDDPELEANIRTLQYMSLVGREYVRGGKWSNEILSAEENKEIDSWFYSVRLVPKRHKIIILESNYRKFHVNKKCKEAGKPPKYHKENIIVRDPLRTTVNTMNICNYDEQDIIQITPHKNAMDDSLICGIILNH